MVYFPLDAFQYVASRGGLFRGKINGLLFLLLIIYIGIVMKPIYYGNDDLVVPAKVIGWQISIHSINN